MSELLDGFLNLDDVRKKNFADLMDICKNQQSRIAALEQENAALRAQLGQGEAVELDAYDAGYLNDYGGGKVGWWQDYIRSELGRAHDFYQSQLIAPQSKPVSEECPSPECETCPERSPCSHEEAIASKPVSERELPPIPEPTRLLYSPTNGHVYGFTVAQMQEYARAALGDQTK